MYRVLHANVYKEAKTIIGQRSTEGGNEAWKHLQKYYGRHDVGSLLAKLNEYGNLKWSGGDSASFLLFILMKTSLRNDLLRKDFDLTNERFSVNLLSINSAFVPLNGSVDLTDMKKIKLDEKFGDKKTIF